MDPGGEEARAGAAISSQPGAPEGLRGAGTYDAGDRRGGGGAEEQEVAAHLPPQQDQLRLSILLYSGTVVHSCV